MLNTSGTTTKMSSMMTQGASPASGNARLPKEESDVFCETNRFVRQYSSYDLPALFIEMTYSAMKIATTARIKIPSISMKMELLRSFTGKSGCGEPSVTISIILRTIDGKKQRKITSTNANRAPLRYSLRY